MTTKFKTVYIFLSLELQDNKNVTRKNKRRSNARPIKDGAGLVSI